jgi:hypothetical protein
MQKIRKISGTRSHSLAEPLRKDNWENAKMAPLGSARLSSGWQRLDRAKDELARRFGGRLPALYKAERAGETISFRFKGTSAKIYDLLGPDCGQITVAVDDRPKVIRPRFDEYCTYHRLATLGVASDLADAEHTVTLEIHPEQPDKRKILSKRGQRIDDPARYDGTVWYAGAILLLGELIE